MCTLVLKQTTTDMTEEIEMLREMAEGQIEKEKRLLIKRLMIKMIKETRLSNQPWKFSEGLLSSDVNTNADSVTTPVGFPSELGCKKVEWPLHRADRCNNRVELSLEVIIREVALSMDTKWKSSTAIGGKTCQVALQNDAGWSALICASSKGHCEVVKLLLEKGVPVDLQDSAGWSALMCASSKGHCEVVKLLLEKDAQVDLQDGDGWSALMRASSKGHCEVVKLLLEKGAQVDLQDGDGWSALMRASRNGHCEVVKLLLEKGAQVDLENGEGHSSLIHASRNGHCEAIKLLLEKNVQVDLQDGDGWSALMRASRNGHCEVVKLLLEKGAQVDLENGEGHSSLMHASLNGHCEVIKLLLEKNVQVDLQDGDGLSALMRASWNGYCEEVKLLLEKDKIDLQDLSAVMRASWKLLRGNHAQVDLQNGYGLSATSRNGHDEVAELQYSTRWSTLINANMERLFEVIKPSGIQMLAVQNRYRFRYCFKKLLDACRHSSVIEMHLKLLAQLEEQLYCQKNKEEEKLNTEDENQRDGMFIQLKTASDFFQLCTCTAKAFQHHIHLGLEIHLTLPQMSLPHMSFQSLSPLFSCVIPVSLDILPFEVISACLPFSSSSIPFLMSLKRLHPPLMSLPYLLEKWAVLHIYCFLIMTLLSIVALFCLCILLLLCGDIETNPGPTSKWLCELYVRKSH